MTTALLSSDTTESINCNVDAFGTFISDWEIVSPEDLIVNRSLQNKIQTAILKAAQSILQLKSDEIGDDDDDKESKSTANQSTSGTSRPLAHSNPDDESPPAVEWLERRPSCVANLLFPVASYHLLQDQKWLPESHGHLRLSYELELNHLIVHLASPAHDAAANAFNFTFVLWSLNGGIGPETLHHLGAAQWRYRPGAEKSPDQSFTPIALTSPPARIIPGTIKGPYPTVVIQVSGTNESYEQLLEDAAFKHFSNETSIQIWIGVKLYTSGGGRMKCMFRLRDQVNGGALAGSGASTGYISLNQPTTTQFIIPKARVFWGVNPPLPVTLQSIPGPNALPPPAVPGVVTDDLVLSLEHLREVTAKYWPGEQGIVCA
jgi:hypothetical protein